MLKDRVGNKRFVYSSPLYMIIVFRNFRITTFTRNNRTLHIRTPKTGINPSKTYLTLPIKLNHHPIIPNN